MRYFMGIIFIAIALSGCATHTDDAYYERANKANDKAQADLQK